MNFNNGIIDANGLAGTPDTLDPNGAPVLVRIRNILQDVGPDLLAPQQTYQERLRRFRRQKISHIRRAEWRKPSTESHGGR